MLAALNVVAVGLGVAGGGLLATVAALGFGAILTGLEVSDGANLGLLLGVTAGLVFGGWVSGRLAVHSHRFHGSITGLILTGVLVLLASAGAANISIWAVVTAALLGIVVGGFGGWFGGRNRPPTS